jgi:hypothetical protein
MKTTEYKTLQKHPKCLYKPLKIASTFTSIDACQIPSGAVYGRITPNMYIYISDFDQFKFKQSSPKYVMYIMDMRSDKKFRRVSLTPKNFAYKSILAFIKTHNLTGVCGKYYHESRKYQNKNGEVAGAPRERLIPEPSMRCYRQSMVDGKGYNIDWERNVLDKNADGTEYKGMESRRGTQFNEFEGVDYRLSRSVVDDYADTKYRDGMKINQTKIRPDKSDNKNNKKIIVRVHRGDTVINKEI